MKALVGAFNQEKALVGAFSVIVKPVEEPMDRFAALANTNTSNITHYSIYLFLYLAGANPMVLVEFNKEFICE